MSRQWLATHVVRNIIGAGALTNTNVRHTGQTTTTRNTPEIVKVTRETGGGQAQSGAETRDGTEGQTGREDQQESGKQKQIQHDDIGCEISFSIPIRGGLGTVPEGSEPAAPLCPVA